MIRGRVGHLDRGRGRERPEDVLGDTETFAVATDVDVGEDDRAVGEMLDKVDDLTLERHLARGGFLVDKVLEFELHPVVEFLVSTAFGKTLLDGLLGHVLLQPLSDCLVTGNTHGLGSLSEGLEALLAALLAVLAELLEGFLNRQPRVHAAALLLPHLCRLLLLQSRFSCWL